MEIRGPIGVETVRTQVHTSCIYCRVYLINTKDNQGYAEGISCSPVSLLLSLSYEHSVLENSQSKWFRAASRFGDPFFCAVLAVSTPWVLCGPATQGSVYGPERKMENQKSVKDEALVAEGNIRIDGAEPAFGSYVEPGPGTIAALEFQVACLLDDRLSLITWPGREPLIVNRPGDLAMKYETLRRIAKANFPSRGDLEDVLNRTIDEYGLMKFANPFGFWTAFKRDMIDAKKAASEAKRVYLENAIRNSSDGTRRERNSHIWTPSQEALITDEQSARKWFAEWPRQRHSDAIFSKLERVKASGRADDRLVVKAIGQLLANKAYMEELGRSTRQVAKLTGLVAEIRSLAGCSQAEAYRLLGDFKRRYSSRHMKS